MRKMRGFFMPEEVGTSMFIGKQNQGYSWGARLKDLKITKFLQQDDITYVVLEKPVSNAAQLRCTPYP